MRERHHERLLFRRYARHPTPELRAEIVARHLGLARSVARRFSVTSVPADDLDQIASIGLLKAIERYDPERGTAFSSYAVPTIVGEIRRYIRDHTWAVRPPRDLQERALALRDASDAYTNRHGRVPTPRELAAELGTTMEDVVESIEAGAARGSTSLDRPVRADEAGSVSLADTIGAADARLDRVEDACFLQDILRALPERDQEILRLRFAEDLTQAEIGRRVGLSQMHVSRILRVALAELADAADDPRLARA